jgi:hypothetical protein
VPFAPLLQLNPCWLCVLEHDGARGGGGGGGGVADAREEELAVRRRLSFRRVAGKAHKRIQKHCSKMKAIATRGGWSFHPLKKARHTMTRPSLLGGLGPKFPTHQTTIQCRKTTMVLIVKLKHSSGFNRCSSRRSAVVVERMPTKPSAIAERGEMLRFVPRLHNRTRSVARRTPPAALCLVFEWLRPLQRLLL